MKTWFNNHLLPAAGISILAVSPCLAQGAIVPSPGTPSASPSVRQGRLITLRNVPSNIIAWWLDPKNHPQPPGFTLESPLPGVALPVGVERIIANAPDQIIVIGTAEAVREVQDRVQLFDRPGDKIPLIAPKNPQINVGARLLTIKSENLGGIWAALQTQTGRATPAIAFLKPEEESALDQQISRREARIESSRSLTIASGTAQLLYFGPPGSNADKSAWMRDFQSAMPVIPPPETGDMRNFGAGRTGRLLPAPLGDLRLQMTPTLQPDRAISLDLRDFNSNGILGRATSARFNLLSGDTLVLALPSSTPGTSAFLLFKAASAQSFGPLYRVPNRAPLLGDLPDIGKFFTLPQAPQKTP